jgi:hypothetical protein
MKKIIDFISALGNKVVVFLRFVKKKLFWRFEEKKKISFKKGLVIGFIFGLIVFSLVIFLWYKTNNTSINELGDDYLAQAKVYVLTHNACKDTCWDTELFIEALNQQGVAIAEVKNLQVGAWPFSLGRQIVKDYQIEKLPTVVVEFTGKGEAKIEDFFNEELGKIVDGKFVLTSILAPYYNLSSKKIEGLVDVVYLTDSSCTECYDVKKHDLALSNLGINTANAKIIEVSSDEGKQLIDKYQITKVPTVMISGELDAYTVFKSTWGDVGFVADDGTHIFTELDLMGDSYKDLSSGKIIESNPDKYYQDAPAQ